MFKHMTEEHILKKMKGQITHGVNTEEGTLVHDALAPTAMMLAQGYSDLDGVHDLAFAETSEGEYLDRRAAERPVWRKPAAAAQAVLTLLGEPEFIIPKGSAFSTAEGVIFQTDEAAVLSETGITNVGATAMTPGVEGNVPSGSISEVLSVELPSTLTVINELPATGGVDTESDASLLARYLQHIREPSTSGNPAHYVQWALEVQGVGAARCQRTWAGPGTVRVIIVDADRQPVDETVVERCFDYIAERHPIGPEVTVVSAFPVEVNVAARVTLATAYTTEIVKASLSEALRAMLAGDAFQVDTIRLSVVGGVLIDVPGVLDYDDLTLNGVEGNVQVSDDRVAVLGQVVLAI